MDEIKLYLLTLAAGLVAVVIPHAHAESISEAPTFRPYMGAEMQKRYTGHSTGAGSNLYERQLFSQHAFLGTKIGDFLGLETGYHQGKTKRQNATNSELVHQGHHFNIVGYLPLTKQPGLELIGSFGVSFLRANYTNQTPNSDKFKQRKSMPRAMVGMHIPLSETWKFRASLVWENTSKMQFQNRSSSKICAANIQPTDSWTMGVGLVHEF